MNYSPHHNAFVIKAEELKRAASSLKYAMYKARKVAGRPLERHERGQVDDAYMVESQIIQAAKELGIDFGVQFPGELDLSEFKEG